MANYKPAVVTNCLRMVLRTHPSLNADAVTSLTCLTDVEVDLDKSDESFFCVRTSDNQEGYCLKRYIALRQRR